MMQLLRTTVLAFAIFVTTACGQGVAPGASGSASQASDATSSSATPVAVVPSIQPAPSNDALKGDSGQVMNIVGSLTRSGGIAGRTETLVVLGDGTLQLLNGDTSGQVVKTAQAPSAQVDSLEAAFTSSEWQQLEASYGRQVPDGYAYTIRGGGKEVQTYDGAQNPPLLDTVLNQMNELWQVAQAGQ